MRSEQEMGMRDGKWLMLSETRGLRARVKTAVAEEDHRIEGGFLFLVVFNV